MAQLDDSTMDLYLSVSTPPFSSGSGVCQWSYEMNNLPYAKNDIKMINYS